MFEQTNKTSKMNTTTKVVITPGNTRATAFFEELSKKKAETKKKIANLPSVKKLLAKQS